MHSFHLLVDFINLVQDAKEFNILMRIDCVSNTSNTIGRAATLTLDINCYARESLNSADQRSGNTSQKSDKTNLKLFTHRRKLTRFTQHTIIGKPLERITGSKIVWYLIVN